MTLIARAFSPGTRRVLPGHEYSYSTRQSTTLDKQNFWLSTSSRRTRSDGQHPHVRLACRT